MQIVTQGLGELFCICFVQYGSHPPHVATERLICGCYDEIFKIWINLNSCKWLVASVWHRAWFIYQEKSDNWHIMDSLQDLSDIFLPFLFSFSYFLESGLFWLFLIVLNFWWTLWKPWGTFVVVVVKPIQLWLREEKSAKYDVLLALAWRHTPQSTRSGAHRDVQWELIRYIHSWKNHFRWQMLE